MAKKSRGENSSKDKISKCSICMETRARAEASCSHKFCMRCITRWTRKIQTCPLCRGRITEIRYGNRVKVIEQTRRDAHVGINTVPNVRQVRMRIEWKPLIFIGVPYFNYFLAGAPMPASVLF